MAQRRYIDEHRTAALGTGPRDGARQVPSECLRLRRLRRQKYQLSGRALRLTMVLGYGLNSKGSLRSGVFQDFSMNSMSLPYNEHGTDENSRIRMI